MELFEIAILVVMGFICTYALVDRVCKCFEHCNTAKSFNKFMDASSKKGVKIE